MNEQMKPAAMLEAAAELITRVLAQMDTAEDEPCETCRRPRRRNTTQARIYENLSTVPSRLLNAAARLQGRDYSIGSIDRGDHAARRR